MSTLTKVTAKTAAESCKHFALSDEGKKVLRDNMTPAQALDALVAAKQYVDAVRLLAFGLPKREAVWWACQCARQAVAAPPPKVAAALASAEKWVKDPTDENRRANQTAAEAAELATPAGCAAMAAFMSGGSIA